MLNNLFIYLSDENEGWNNYNMMIIKKYEGYEGFEGNKTLRIPCLFY